jgi:hypothetical protein
MLFVIRFIVIFLLVAGLNLMEDLPKFIKALLGARILEFFNDL